MPLLFAWYSFCHSPATCITFDSSLYLFDLQFLCLSKDVSSNFHTCKLSDEDFWNSLSYGNVLFEQSLPLFPCTFSPNRFSSTFSSLELPSPPQHLMIEEGLKCHPLSVCGSYSRQRPEPSVPVWILPTDCHLWVLGDTHGYRICKNRDAF